MRESTCVVLLCVVVAAAACGGGQKPSEPTPAPPTPNTVRVTISSAGVSTAELVVTPGTSVLFVNNDSRPHFMASDPHPDHQDCTPLNLVGLLRPGDSRATGNLVETRTCGFHDHDNPTVDSLRGRIVIR